MHAINDAPVWLGRGEMTDVGQVWALSKSRSASKKHLPFLPFTETLQRSLQAEDESTLCFLDVYFERWWADYIDLRTRRYSFICGVSTERRQPCKIASVPSVSFFILVCVRLDHCSVQQRAWAMHPWLWLYFVSKIRFFWSSFLVWWSVVIDFICFYCIFSHKNNA